jgi:hypothetical protein
MKTAAVVRKRSDGAEKVKTYKAITIYGGSNSKASALHISQS